VPEPIAYALFIPTFIILYLFSFDYAQNQDEDISK
jgi:hypothetical protein